MFRLTRPKHICRTCGFALFFSGPELVENLIGVACTSIAKAKKENSLDEYRSAGAVELIAIESISDGTADCSEWQERFKVKKGKLARVCSWCHEFQGYKNGHGQDGITHTMCGHCYRENTLPELLHSSTRRIIESHTRFNEPRDPAVRRFMRKESRILLRRAFVYWWHLRFERR